MKNKILFYPTNLNIKQLIQDDVKLSTTQKSEGIKYYQRVLYPISRIIQEYRLNKSFKDDSIDNLYVNLNYNLLIELVGKRYYWIMPFLLRNNILVKSKLSYSVGNHSNSFRIGDLYLSKHYTKEILNIDTDKTLYNNLNKRINLNNPYIKYVYDNLKQIKIDGKKAIQILNDKINSGENINNYYNLSNFSLMYPPITETYMNKRFINEYFDSIIDLDLLEDEHKIEVFNNWMINITKILEGDWFITIGNSSGRIFTNITSLPRELRECLYIENPNEGNNKNKNPHGLYEVDIANSQPFLFNKYLLENYNLQEDLFGDKYEDIRKYIELTSTGKLYDYLMEEWGLLNRELFKKDFFGSIFYCKSTSNLRNFNSKRFSELFPNVMKLVLKMKEGNYKNLSIQLQKFEVEIIINKVSQKLFSEGLTHFTIHDSILCYEEDKVYVASLIQAEMKEYGLTPTIKIK